MLTRVVSYDELVESDYLVFILYRVTKDTLLWRHNGRDCVSNHQPHDCLLKRLFRRRSKKTSKLRITGLCAGNSPGPVNSPHKWPVTRKMFPFDDVMTSQRRFNAFNCLHFIAWGRVRQVPNDTSIHAVTGYVVTPFLWKIEREARNTVKCRYNAFKFITLHTTLRQQWQKLNRILESQQILHISPSRSIAGILEKIDRVITASHCIWRNNEGRRPYTRVL